MSYTGQGKTYVELKIKQAKSKAKRNNSKKFLAVEKQGLFLQWLSKKVKYNKLTLSEHEAIILQDLNRIKKIKRTELYRVYQFISSRFNKQKSFYLILDGRNSIEIRQPKYESGKQIIF